MDPSQSPSVTATTIITKSPSFSPPKFRLEVYENEMIPEELLLQSVDFVNEMLPDENFEATDFSKIYGKTCLYKNIFMYYMTTSVQGKINDRLVGVSVCNFYPDPDPEKSDDVLIYMMVIAVDKGQQGRGIGSKFLGSILQMNNQSDIWIKIHKENDQSQGFFKKMGFVKRPKKSMPEILNPSYRKPYEVYVKRRS
jgi:ribosomal protein S18 acetylase RimI-like enzyme